MSIANGTTYYDYPQVQLTDRPTFADYNPAFSDIDAKLYALITGAITDESDIASLKEDMAQAKLDIVAAQGVADRADGKADVNAENITLLQGSVGAVERDVANKLYSVAIAEPYDATSGTYDVGNVVVYNGQRYVCSTAVTVAEPFDADKWTGEDVQTVLEDISVAIAELDNDKADKRETASVTADGVKTYSQILDSLFALRDQTKLTGNSTLVRDASGVTTVYNMATTSSSGDVYHTLRLSSGTTLVYEQLILLATSSTFVDNIPGGATTDHSSEVPANGVVFTLTY